MAKSSTPSTSASAADLLLRRQLREAVCPASAPASENHADDTSSAEADPCGTASDGSLRAETPSESSDSGADGVAIGVDELIRPAARIPSNGAVRSGQPLPVEAEALRLRVENEELRKLIEEMKVIFAQAAEQEAENARIMEQLRAENAEFARQLTEKSAEIDLLHGQIQELETHIQQSVPAPPPTEDELSKLADELEKERVQLARDRKDLETEREQLREDEQDMMRQMREMEVQMAKERAEMARQRTELQRLHAEVQRELEQMQGTDRALTERLQQLSRRHQELINRAGSAPPSSMASGPASMAAGPKSVAAPRTPAPPGKKDSGLFGRFFGRK
jgi:hypothetical protein